MFPQFYSFLLVCSFQFSFGCTLRSTHFVYRLPGYPRLPIFHWISNLIYLILYVFCLFFFSFRVFVFIRFFLLHLEAVFTSARFSLTANVSHGTLDLVLVFVGIHFAAASRCALTKFSYSSFGVHFSVFSCSVSNLFLNYIYIYKGWLESSWADQDTFMECDQMRYIFQHCAPSRTRTSSIGAWILLVKKVINIIFRSINFPLTLVYNSRSTAHTHTHTHTHTHQYTLTHNNYKYIYIKTEMGSWWNISCKTNLLAFNSLFAISHLLKYLWNPSFIFLFMSSPS